MSGDELREPFASGLLEACRLSGLPVAAWRTCFRGAQRACLPLARTQGFSEDVDPDSDATAGMVTLMIAGLAIRLPERLMAAAKRRVATLDDDLPPEVRAEHAQYPTHRLMLEIAIALAEAAQAKLPEVAN